MWICNVAFNSIYFDVFYTRLELCLSSLHVHFEHSISTRALKYVDDELTRQLALCVLCTQAAIAIYMAQMAIFSVDASVPFVSFWLLESRQPTTLSNMERVHPRIRLKLEKYENLHKIKRACRGCSA